MAQESNAKDPSMLPGLAPPLGVVPNFNDPYSLQPALIAVFALYLTSTALTTVLRMYTKFYITKTPGWGDYTACIATLGFIVQSACVFSTLPFGAAIHQWNVPLTSLAPFARHAMAAEIVYPPVIFFAKLSVLLQFIHFFVPNHGSTSFKVVWATIIFNFLFLTVAMLLFALQCIPLAIIWDPTISGHCVNQSVLYITIAGFIIFSDFQMLFLPLVWIWRSMTSTKRKLGVSMVFAIGIMACITSILHCYYSVLEYGSGDDTFVLAQLTFATGGEITSAILCTNLPILPRFFRHIAPKVATVVSRLHSSKNNIGSSSSPRSPVTPSPHGKGPIPSWAYLTPRRFRPNHLGLETRDVKGLGIRTLIEADIPLETTRNSGTDDSESWSGKRGGDLEYGVEKDGGGGGD